MERREIERTDFPTSKEGYDPAEVERHLRRVADAVEELRRGGGSLAGAAAEQVREIVEAAERSAHEVGEQARRDADAVRTAAESEAAALRARVREAVGTLEERANAVERDLGGLVERLRSTVDGIVRRLRESAGELSSELEGLRAVPASVSATGEPSPEPAVPEAEPPEPELEPEPVAEGQETPGEGHEGARLIALNMALDGIPREETARYLEENFELEDAKAILDEVYARVG